MGIGAGTAALIGAGLSLGGSIYSANKQKEAQEEAQRQAELARRQEEERQRAIFEATKPEQDSATFDFGIDDEDEELIGYSEFIAPKPTTPLGGTTKTLGFGTLGV